MVIEMSLDQKSYQTTKNNNLEINETCNLIEPYDLPALIAHFSLMICGEKRKKFFNTVVLKS